MGLDNASFEALRGSDEFAVANGKARIAKTTSQAIASDQSWANYGSRIARLQAKNCYDDAILVQIDADAGPIRFISRF